MIDSLHIDEARKCTLYEVETGRVITLAAMQPEVWDLARTEKNGLIAGWHDAATHYVSNGVATRRPANPARLDGMTLRDLPVPCVIVIDGARYDCADTTAELDFPVAKTYRIAVDAFPTQDATFEVTKQ